jgi:hypothetical protein
MATQLLEDLLQKCHKPPFTMIVPAGHLASGLNLTTNISSTVLARR